MKTSATALAPTRADAGEERSFSTHPRRRPRLSPERLAFLERCETEMAEKLERVLERHAARAAFVGRAGSDLSRLRFENERPRVTHVGMALREAEGWTIHHLMNTGEGREGHLYRQPLVDFFRDDPWEYRCPVLVPSLALQEGLARVLASPLREALHTLEYSRVAYPFSTRYQNSNQWVLEVVAAAQSGCATRAEAQRHLAARGLQPSVLCAVGVLKQTLGRLASRNTRFDDHPLAERLRGRITFLLGSSLCRYVRRSDEVLAAAEIELDRQDTADQGGGHAQSQE